VRHTIDPSDLRAEAKRNMSKKHNNTTLRFLCEEWDKTDETAKHQAHSTTQQNQMAAVSYIR
jgi:hypothetical protein